MNYLNSLRLQEEIRQHQGFATLAKSAYKPALIKMG